MQNIVKSLSTLITVVENCSYTTSILDQNDPYEWMMLVLWNMYVRDMDEAFK